MGVLANHVPSIEQLKPGLVEIIEESGGSKHFFRMCPSQFSVLEKQWMWYGFEIPVVIRGGLGDDRICDGMPIPAQLEAGAITRVDTGFTVSGGFAVVQPGSQLSINAVEGFPLEDFSTEVSFRSIARIIYAGVVLIVSCRLSGIRLRRHKLSLRFVIKLDGSLESLRLANTTAQVLESLQAAMK
jgi:F0F1-type ATP synthase epsilon subunit